MAETTLADTIKNAAKKQWSDKIGGGLHSTVVPEWTDENGDPVTIYFNPPSLATRISVSNEFAKRSTRTQWDLIAVELCTRCLDKDGKRIFGKTEITEIETMYDPDVLAQIYEEVTGTFDKPSKEIEEDIEGAKKP